MKKNVMFIVLFLSYFLGFSQVKFPKNPKTGKCYMIKYDVDKEIAWEEIPCADRNKLKKSRLNELRKFIDHLKKLDSLGYEVDLVRPYSDKNTIAHNKYLRVLKKEQRKKKRLIKRKKAVK